MIPGSFAKELPMLLFGVLAVLAGLATLVLPESADGGLPDTLEDMKKKSRYLFTSWVICMLFHCLLILINRFKIIFLEYHQCVYQFESRFIGHNLGPSKLH